MLSTWLPASIPDETNLLNITRAKGSYLYTADGRELYDGVSSWWCKPLGHCHPIVTDALARQASLFEHHIPANATNSVIEELSSRLLGIFTQMDKVMYASDGSSAIEIAMKLAYEARLLNGEQGRNHFIALSGAYHGETALTLSVYGINAYKKNYQGLLIQNFFIQGLIYVNSSDEDSWHESDFDEALYREFFNQHASKCCALIIEPIIQGANGLRIISKDFLSRLIHLAREYGLYIIADEIMVGLGRLGCHSVCVSYLEFEPDIVCFAKNLTAGVIPMSAVVINKKITDIFRYYRKLFPHSHTHSCNTLGASVANAYLNYLANSDMLIEIKQNELGLLKMMQDFASKYDFIINPRAIGGIAACDLNLPASAISQIFNLGIQCGIYLRPINNTLYVMPPLHDLTSDSPIIKSLLTMVLEVLQKWE
jgi:adenosylmethionine-8-amino-7-oxononanoate aminotransferase